MESINDEYENNEKMSEGDERDNNSDEADLDDEFR